MDPFATDATFKQVLRSFLLHLHSPFCYAWFMQNHLLLEKFHLPILKTKDVLRLTKLILCYEAQVCSRQGFDVIEIDVKSEYIGLVYKRNE